jgi:hypothetical protein
MYASYRPTALEGRRALQAQGTRGKTGTQRRDDRPDGARVSPPLPSEGSAVPADLADMIGRRTANVLWPVEVPWLDLMFMTSWAGTPRLSPH